MISSTYCSSKVRLLAVYIAAFLPAIGYAQDESEQSATPADEAVEEIIVYGNRPLHQLRREFERAQEEFFDVFSELTNNEQFKFKCEYVTSAGSRKRHHLCMPKFARTAQRRENEEMMTTFEIMGGARPGASMRPGSSVLGGYTFFASPANRKRIQKSEEEMRVEMRELLAESEQMQQALRDLVKARNIYSSEYLRRCEEQGRECEE